MHIGIVVSVVMHDCLEYGFWHLHGRGVVQVDEAMAEDFLVEYGKILADIIDAQHGCSFRSARAHVVDSVRAKSLIRLTMATCPATRLESNAYAKSVRWM